MSVVEPAAPEHVRNIARTDSEIPVPAPHANMSFLRRFATLDATISFSFNTAGLALAINLAASTV